MDRKIFGVTIKFSQNLSIYKVRRIGKTVWKCMQFSLAIQLSG